MRRLHAAGAQSLSPSGHGQARGWRPAAQWRWRQARSPGECPAGKGSRMCYGGEYGPRASTAWRQSRAESRPPGEVTTAMPHDSRWHPGRLRQPPVGLQGWARAPVPQPYATPGVAPQATAQQRRKQQDLMRKLYARQIEAGVSPPWSTWVSRSTNMAWCTDQSSAAHQGQRSLPARARSAGAAPTDHRASATSVGGGGGDTWWRTSRQPPAVRR